MTQTVPVQPKKYLPELQSVRGIAALTVLFCHCTFYYGTRQWSRYVEVFAHAAVVIFFVLSGYVLCLSLSGAVLNTSSALAFYIRRLFRIYPALLFASLIGLSYLLIFNGHHFSSHVSTWWLEYCPPQAIRPWHVLAAALAVGADLPLPIWSLFIELLGSLLMPFIVIATAKGKWSSLAVIAVLGAFSLFGPRTHMDAGVYLVDFALGASITRFPEIFEWLTASVRRARIVALLSLCGMLVSRQISPGGLDAIYNSPIPSNLQAIFATILVGVIAARRPAFCLLSADWLVDIGDKSYSIYLLHLPILGLIAGIGGEYLHIPIFAGSAPISSATLLCCTLLVTIPLSAACYRFI
jgi:peptidoglycan/LPS O-acetylase OafA/YrhL